MRDFIYIDDCVKAVAKSMNKINDGSALNLSSGKYVSFKNFAQLTAKIVGFKPSIEGTQNTPEGVFARAGDTSKQKKFGIKHSVNLEQGIKKCINYLLKIN